MSVTYKSIKVLLDAIFSFKLQVSTTLIGHKVTKALANKKQTSTYRVLTTLEMFPRKYSQLLDKHFVLNRIVLVSLQNT